MPGSANPLEEERVIQTGGEGQSESRDASKKRKADVLEEEGEEKGEEDGTRANVPDKPDLINPRRKKCRKSWAYIYIFSDYY